MPVLEVKFALAPLWTADNRAGMARRDPITHFGTGPGVELAKRPGDAPGQTTIPMYGPAINGYPTSYSPLGSKSAPPLPPPMGRVVREFLKICSKPAADDTSGEGGKQLAQRAAVMTES
jgi:hypothetical protein